MITICASLTCTFSHAVASTKCVKGERVRKKGMKEKLGEARMVYKMGQLKEKREFL